jgi:hypothetical protein
MYHNYLWILCTARETEVKPSFEDTLNIWSYRPERGLPVLSRVVVLINS